MFSWHSTQIFLQIICYSSGGSNYYRYNPTFNFFTFLLFLNKIFILVSFCIIIIIIIIIAGDGCGNSIIIIIIIIISSSSSSTSSSSSSGFYGTHGLQMQ